ncbi:MAG: nitroreductase family deazaflavin-dependent oxidoreductase [Pseudomonadales bacterium]|nr:nitroreductase family deazaflavin-dependent oxidoreductase [Pseudomonadales bacterium]MBO6563704.1 nitroreductase family deazaflavin-dependent oxidoreductase [Pseudomonadales bacterium]MBO6596762.1 nitroreductase family deazaflavin-dependent oxidoreductase [Pseudomonadales bacterium]MBO6656064.1 nitroreductase family deazaflavin-dependent oxidoreductase [Pseudomonadales bacterium]MBO6823249.1 nitroreductase family deazaflavin-dependent oxidoreductase [Pseudomonadales bacterium]
MSDQKRKDKGSPPPRWLLKLATKINVFVYKNSGGRLMNKLAGMPILLVEMTGAKSGRTITIPLMYVPHGDGFVLVASQGGAPTHPIWFHNLVKHPQIRVTYDGKTTPMTAKLASDEEKAEVWPTCCEYYPPYQEYQDRTDRNIPVFICA